MSDYQQIMTQARQVQAAAIQHAQREISTMQGSTETSSGAGDLYPGGPEQYFADIPGLYQPFSQLPDPDAYTSTITALENAMDWIRLSPDSAQLIDRTDGRGMARPEIAKLGSEGDLMPGWNGQAALAFKGDFLGRFPTYTQNQFTLIATLKASAEAHQQLWRSARTDISKIADVHLTALEHSGCDQNSWVLTFTILSSIAWLPAMPLTAAGLGAAATAVTVVGSVSSMAGSYTPLAMPNQETTSHSGDSAREIVDQMKTAIDGLYQRIATAQSKIIDALQSAIETVLDAGYKKEYFEAPRPALADMSTTQAKTDQGLGTPGQA